MSDNTALGDRMKLYERLGATDQLMPSLPIIVRLDGRAFHSFTRGLARPYDERLSRLMVSTAMWVAEESNACVAYTQSDEISLLLWAKTHESQAYFNGRRDKIVSILAGVATLYFNRNLPDYIPEKAAASPLFDARAFTVPSKVEAVNYFIWREQDAVRNSISMAAQAHFSHKSLHGVNTSQMQERLFSERGINWNDYPSFFRRGSYVQRRTISRPFTCDELEKLPPKHEARANPELVIERQEFQQVELPRLTQVLNAQAVLFDGEEEAMVLKQREPAHG